MPRPKKNGERGKPGPKGWVFGTKLDFFESRREDWQKCVQRGKSGTFYTHITKLYLLKYGTLSFTEDLPEDTDDPEDDSFDLEDDDLTEEERKTKQAEFKKLRTVRTILIFPVLSLNIALWTENLRVVSSPLSNDYPEEPLCPPTRHDGGQVYAAASPTRGSILFISLLCTTSQGNIRRRVETCICVAGTRGREEAGTG